MVEEVAARSLTLGVLFCGGVWKPAKAGTYVLKVRAKDGFSVLQIAKRAPTLPDGASGYHTLRVQVGK